MKITYAVLLLMLICTFGAFAQPGGGGPGTPTPIDGGIGILMAAGAAYGYKKMVLDRNRYK